MNFEIVKNTALDREIDRDWQFLMLDRNCPPGALIYGADRGVSLDGEPGTWWPAQQLPRSMSGRWPGGRPWRYEINNCLWRRPIRVNIDPAGMGQVIGIAGEALHRGALVRLDEDGRVRPVAKRKLTTQALHARLALHDIHPTSRRCDRCGLAEAEIYDAVDDPQCMRGGQIRDAYAPHRLKKLLEDMEAAAIAHERAALGGSLERFIRGKLNLNDELGDGIADRVQGLKPAPRRYRYACAILVDDPSGDDVA